MILRHSGGHYEEHFMDLRMYLSTDGLLLVRSPAASSVAEPVELGQIVIRDRAALRRDQRPIRLPKSQASASEAPAPRR